MRAERRRRLDAMQLSRLMARPEVVGRPRQHVFYRYLLSHLSVGFLALLPRARRNVVNKH